MRCPEKWDEGETGASLWEVIGLEGAVMGMVLGREGTRAGSEAALGGQWSVPGLLGSLPGVPCWCWWVLLSAVLQHGSLGT